MKRQKTGGRKKGTPNRRTQEFQQLLAELNFDPTTELIRELKKPNSPPVKETLVQEVDEKGKTKTSKRFLPDLNAAFNKERAKILERLHEFLYPRRKAQEGPPPAPPETPTGEDLTDVSTEDLLKAARGPVQ